MTKKKITAPLSYDPGKGRPKEHLAYLNWQEMQALQRLNGGNMERGPRGLPSFPPADAIGSSQNAATGNWTGSPGGTTSTGPSSSYQGSGTSTNWGGSNNYGTDPSSWSGSGSNYGGAGAPTSSTASSSAASSAASSSAASANTTDTAAQQTAAVNNAAAAVRNAALSEDARRAGIGSIEVGPMRTPVNIGGGTISAAVQSGIQQSYASVSPTMPGGGGMGQLNARRGSLTTAVGPSTGIDAFGNIATGSVFGTSPSIASKYDSLEADIDRRNLTRIAEAARVSTPVSLSAPSGTYGPRVSMDRTYYPDAPSGATIGPRQYSVPSLSEFDNYPSEFDGIGGPTDRAVTQALKDKAYNAYKTISNYFSGQPSDYVADVSKLPQLNVSPPDIRNPNSMRVVGGLGVASLPGGPQSLSVKTHPSFDTVQRDYTYGGGTQISTPGSEQVITRSADGLGVEDQIDLRIGPNYVPGEGYVPTVDRMGPFNTAHDLSKERVIKVEDVPEDLSVDAENEIANVEEQYRKQPGGIASLPGVSPMQDEAVYPEKTAVQKYIAENIPYAKYAVKIADFFGRREFEGLTPEEKNALAAKWVSEQDAFKRGNIPENRPDREVTPYIQPPYRPVARQSPQKPSQYDLWDKGIGIPEPGDPDYNDYMKYLESRGTSAQV